MEDASLVSHKFAIFRFLSTINECNKSSPLQQTFQTYLRQVANTKLLKVLYRFGHRLPEESNLNVPSGLAANADGKGDLVMMNNR